MGRQKSKTAKTKKAPNCPECGSVEVIPVVHGIVTPAVQRAIEAGDAIASNREEWEGLTEWYCKSCGCDWSGNWRRFKKGGSVNATR
jgi:hypothetical protein